MTAAAIIVASLGLILTIGIIRRRPGRAVTDVTMLVVVFGLIAIADVLLSIFVDTGTVGSTLAIAIAGAFVIDAIYGLMAPERQRRRDRRLRQIMQRRRA